MPLGQAVRASPRKYAAAMISKSDRFTSSYTYSANEPRNVMAISPAYGDSKGARSIGPGFYEGAEAHTASMIVHSPEKLDQNFMSASPRLPRDKAPMNVGGSVASVGQDKASWKHKAIGAHGPYTSKVGRPMGANIVGPQLGSYEGMWGVGRAASPIHRGADVLYANNSYVKPIAEAVGDSPRLYASSFHSGAPRLHVPLATRRSMRYDSIGATDSLDLAASARNQFANGMRSSVSTLDGFTGRSGSGRSSPAFADTTARFSDYKKVVGTAGDYSALL